MYAHDAVQPGYAGASKRERVEHMFDRIAGRYDLLNRVISLGLDRGWRREVVGEVTRRAPGGRVLDVATGTGDLALALARAGVGEVVGADISAGMLAEAERKVAAERQDAGGRLAAVRFERADALGLPFDDGAFDAVTVAFGVRNFEDLEAGLRELRRVLRPGGAVVVLELGAPRQELLRSLHGWYSRHVLPTIAGVVSGERAAYEYLPESVASFPDSAAFARILGACGFRDVEARPLTFGVTHLYVGVRA
ncbi:MAG: Ubiquinone/menaquinone biosynthesis methyltransferase ubiE [Pseudomonadota bacterium]|jgi:demethylmenaquinone methyltransferase/2-methoxy-6-polyprenyl-1,4-benzoquinol methylase